MIKFTDHDGRGGYTRTKPGRSIAAYNAKPNKIDRHKKTGAARGQFRTEVLNRCEKVVFSTCKENLHQNCAKVIVQDDGSLPKLCICVCHASKQKAACRKSPTARTVGVVEGTIIDGPRAVKQVFLDKTAEQEKQVFATLYPSLKVMYAAHATELQSGHDVLNTKGTVALPRYFSLRGQRHSMRINVLWPENFLNIRTEFVANL